MFCGNPAGLDDMQESYVKEFLGHLAGDFVERCKEDKKQPKEAMEDYLRCIRERLKSPPKRISAFGFFMLSAIEVFFREINNVLTPQSTIEDF